MPPNTRAKLISLDFIIIYIVDVGSPPLDTDYIPRLEGSNITIINQFLRDMGL